jgi:hypothetical protein
MSVISLNPNNKNQYRKFPLKQFSAFQADNGTIISDMFIVNCSITSTYGKHRIYIKQIFRKKNYISIVIVSLLDDVCLGSFSGNITEPFTKLTLNPFVRYVYGSLTVGAIEGMPLEGVYNFEATQTELEESTIFCYTPPAVTSVRDKKQNEIRGYVNFGTLTNIAKTTDNVGKSTKFTALNPKSVFNLADKTSYLNNCTTPVIQKINGVSPFPVNVGDPINDGNIYIVGVKPIVFYGTQGDPGNVVVTTPDMTIDTLCTQKTKLLPPVDVRGFTLPTTEYKSLYYSKPAMPAYPEGVGEYALPIPARSASNFHSTTKPEYYFWPQYVKEEYFASWRLNNPSIPTIISSYVQDNNLYLVFNPPVNDGGSPIVDHQYSLDNGATYATFSQLTPTSPAILSGLVSGLQYNIKLRAINHNGEIGAASHTYTTTFELT